MKKLTKEEYQQVYEKRTRLEEKRRKLAESRASKGHNSATLMASERRPGQEGAGAFLVRKRTKK